MRNPYAAGSSCGSGTYDDFTVISLSPDVGVEEKPDARSNPSTSLGTGMQQAGLELAASPTPAVGRVRIEYSLPQATEVRLSIYDVSGKLVEDLVDSRMEAGSRVVVWDGRDSKGVRVRSGTCFVRLEADGCCVCRKLVVF